MSKIPNNSSQLSLSFVLRKYRTYYHLSERALAEKISVDEKYIIALEKGDYSAFRTISGEDVLRRICFVVGLKFEPLQAIYQREYRIYQNNHKRLIDTILSLFFITPKRMRMIITWFGIAIILVYLGLQGYQIFLRPNVILADKQKIIMTEEDTYLLQGALKQSGKLTLNGEQVTLDSTGTFQITLSLQKGKNIIELVVSKDNQEVSRIYKTIYKTL